MDPVQFFKCLADETRLRSLLLIKSEGELCVCELTEALQEGQPKISRHLAQLRNCGLLLDRRQGQWVYYRLNPDLPQWMPDLLESTAQGNVMFVQESSDNLKRMECRPTKDTAISVGCC